MTRFISLLTIIFAALCLPSAVSAAVLYPLPQQNSVSPDDTIIVPIILDSEGQNINVVEATVTYPSALFEAVDILRANSFLTMWAEEPTIDSSIGRIHLSGGVPNGSVVHNSEAFSIVLRALTAGTGIVNVDSDASTVYLNDGFGTRASLSTRSVQIVNEVGDPFLPQLHSSSHPYETSWYTNREVQMNWSNIPNALYTIAFSKDPAVVPDENPDDVHGFTSLSASEDGIWYFTLRQRIPGEEWSAVATRRVQIDSSAPQSFSVSTIRENGSGAILAIFNPIDQASGLERTDVRLLVPRFSWFPFFPQGEWVQAENPFRIDEHLHAARIEVRAFDKAGNYSEAKLALPLLRQAQLQFMMVVGILIAVLGIVSLVAHTYLANNTNKH